MSDTTAPDLEIPQIYLLTPPEFSLSEFPIKLAAVLDAAPIACLRLRMASLDEDTVARSADAIREVAHARDVPLVIDTHVALVDRLGLDGVHLTDGSRSVRKVRKDLGADAIVGTFCGGSRHDGMSAGEAGADYVSFGPVGETVLGTGETVPEELFAWWSEIVEMPIVAEGALSHEKIRALAPITDFFAFGEEVWSAEDPAARVQELRALFS